MIFLSSSSPSFSWHTFSTSQKPLSVSLSVRLTLVLCSPCASNQNVTTKHQTFPPFPLLLPAFRPFSLLFRSFFLSLFLSFFFLPQNCHPQTVSRLPCTLQRHPFLTALASSRHFAPKHHNKATRRQITPFLTFGIERLRDGGDRDVIVKEKGMVSRLIPKVDAAVPTACDDSGRFVRMPQTTDRDGLVARDFPFGSWFVNFSSL